MSNPIVINPAEVIAMSEQLGASGNPVKWIVSRRRNDRLEYWFLCKQHAEELPGPLLTSREVRPGERKYGVCEQCVPDYHGGK